jgi:hypothetical protein
MKHPVCDSFSRITGSKKLASAWRSETLRLLDPPAPGTMTAENNLHETKQKTAKARKTACIHMADQFLTTTSMLCKGLDGEPYKDMRNSLVSIFLEAGLLSYRMGTQRGLVRSLDVHDLPSLFSASSEIMEPHPRNLEEVDDNTELLNGRRVVLVTHPAIISEGNHDFSDYSVYRVWKRAIVWLGPSA